MADTSVSFEFEGCRQPWESTGSAGLSHVETELIEGLKRGEERAYEALILRLQHPIYSLVCRLMADPSESADVVQEVFLKVFRSMGSFRGQSSLKTWVYRIAVNEANNHRRWCWRRRTREIGLDDEKGDGLTYEDVLADGGRSPFEAAEDNQTRAWIEEGLQKVRPVFREAVVLRDIEGLAYEEIAEILETNLGTVKSRILRGREALRVVLERQEAGRRPRLTNPALAGDEVS